MAQIQSELNISLKLGAQETDYLSRTIRALQLVTSWRTPTPIQKHYVSEQKLSSWITADLVKTDYTSEQEKQNHWLTPDLVNAEYPSEQENQNPWLPVDLVEAECTSEQENPNHWLTPDLVKTEYPSEQKKPNPCLTPEPPNSQCSSEQEQEREQSPKDRIITLSEVSDHDIFNDCWVIIYDRIYDITTFMDEHPGGPEIMLEYAGRDASTAFRGSGHSRSAVRALERFLVGELPMHERIYRKPGGLRLSDIPE